MFFELRQYRILPGKRDEWGGVHGGEDHPRPEAMGAVIVGSFVGAEDDETYVWIRRFESDAQLTAFNDAYYGSDEWKDELEPKVKEMLDFPSMVVTRLAATPKSVIR